MKVVVLAGGLGTRISEESHLKPKPMIEIGGKPILWHILKIYSHYGLNDFIICTGYKGYIIKEYFANYFLHQSDVTFDIKNNQTEIHLNSCEPWKITVVDTGEQTNTGGRIKRIKKYLNDEPFCMTYGDGVSNVDIKKLIEFHKEEKAKVTLTAVQQPGRYGTVNVSEGRVTEFKEKPIDDGAWINGGFFVIEPEVISLIENEQTSWEIELLQILTNNNELAAYKHNDFWLPMDTLRDKIRLEDMWDTNKAPWKVWD
jgi:glucose-1-phosphate cytidylyltransferase